MKDRLEKLRNKLWLLPVASLLLGLLFQSNSDGVQFEQKAISRIMFYNVENLFDTIDSELDDNEFLPGSERRWNGYKYFKKLDNIAKVIVSSGGWEVPALVGLCEIENEEVLSDLISKTILSEVGYSYLYSNSADSRGIGVGLLVADRFSTLFCNSYYPTTSLGDTISTRSVLHSRLADKFDTLDVFVTHWPSRRGGVAETEPLREDVARLIYKVIEEVEHSSNKRRKIIVIGDFNSFPESRIFSDIMRVESEPGESAGRNLVNITLDGDNHGLGTYKYQGSWNLLDQAIIDKSLFDSNSGYLYLRKSFKIISNPGILTEDLSYRGMKPLSTWTGPRYIGGYSDHLPITFDLILK